MLLLLPLKMESEYFRAGIFSAVMTAAILYNAALVAFFPSMGINAHGAVHGLYPADMLLSLVRGAEPFPALCLALFWLVFGHSLEQRLGSVWLGCAWLTGCLLPMGLSLAGVIALDLSYWLGLGGAFFCLGIAYIRLGLEDVQAFYVLGFSAGRTSIGGLIPLFVLHVLLCLTQIVVRERNSPAPPDGIQTPLWLFLYPFILVLVWLASRWMYAKLKGVVGPRPDPG